MAVYYNTVPAQFQKWDKAQFRPGVYRFTLPAGKYSVAVAGACGGSITQKGYEGGGGIVRTQEITLNTASATVVVVGNSGLNGGVSMTETGGGSVLWQYVDYVTSWYDPATGKYKIPLGSGGMQETIYPAANGGYSSISTGNYSIRAEGGDGASASGRGSGGSNHSTGYVTITALNTAPTIPQNVKLDQPYSGRSVNMSCNPSTDSDGDKITYVWEGRTDSNAFTTIGTTTGTEHAIVAPTSGTTYQVRVKAVDSAGSESGYGISPARNIIYNYPPTISGSDVDLGQKKNSFSYSFSVDDKDETDTITVEYFLDDVSIGKITNAVRKRLYYVELADRWAYITQGQHRIRIRATDSEGATAERILAFERSVPGLDLMLSQPIQTRNSAKIRTVQALFFYEAPENATVEIYVTNNAKASNPSWHRYDQFERGHIFEFPTLPLDAEEGFSARIKIIKPPGYTEKITFSGATFMINANGNESEKWADNVLFSNVFSGLLAGVTNVGEMARNIDQSGVGAASAPINTNVNGDYVRIGDLQICMTRISTMNGSKWTSAIVLASYQLDTDETSTEVVSANGTNMGKWTYPAKFAKVPVLFHQPFLIYDEEEFQNEYGMCLMAIGRWR